jgi:hypothetical protein
VSPAKPIQTKEKPFYVHLPSVRPIAAKTLSYWFVHAIEARTNKAEIKKVLMEAGRNAQGAPKAVVARLNAVEKALSARIKRRKTIAYGGDIHLVVVDNASFFYDKPIRETHTPSALTLAAYLNKIGNRYGVYVHYITPAETKMLFPAGFGRKTVIPYAHRDAKRVRVGPGEGTNIALAYVAGFHERQYRGEAYLMRASDDVFPSLNKVKLYSGNSSAVARAFSRMTVFLKPSRHRNFFEDALKAIKGKTSYGGFYKGYRDNSGARIGRADRPMGIPFTIRVASPKELPFYGTEYNEDIHYSTDVPSFNAPPYLFHAGKISTYKMRTGNRDERYFGDFWREKKVEPAGEEFVKRVALKSGLDLLGIQKRTN